MSISDNIDAEEYISVKLDSKEKCIHDLSVTRCQCTHLHMVVMDSNVEMILVFDVHCDT